MEEEQTFIINCPRCDAKGYLNLDRRATCTTCDGHQKLVLPGLLYEYDLCRRCESHGYYWPNQLAVCETCGGKGRIRTRHTIKPKSKLSHLGLHPQIEQSSDRLFTDGHYSQAVFEAAKALTLLVKAKSGRRDLDGKDLMLQVFSKNKPILAFNGSSSDSNLNEQEGMMYLFAGATLAIRNTRAHEAIQDSAERAIEYLAFLSFLANSLDRTTSPARNDGVSGKS